MLDKLKILYKDDDTSDEEYELYLEMAGSEIISYLDPLSTQNKDMLLIQYEMQQLKLAIALLSRRGAESQQSHNENSISRSYIVDLLSKDILKGVSPYGRLLGMTHDNTN